MDRRKFSITILSCLWISVIRGDVCSTKTCIHASATILERMDIDVDPCDNFYDFACGSFIENNYTPDESVAVDTFTKLKETVDSKVNALLMDSLEKPSDMLNLSKSLFETCLERDRSSQEEFEALKAIVKELGGWPLLEGKAWDGTNWSMGEAITKIRKLLGRRSDKIFDIASFIISLENANNPSIRPSATFFSFRNAYFNYISNLATFFGATREASERDDELNHLLDFEYKLNLINQKIQKLSRAGGVKADEALKTIFYIQWLESFHPSELKNIQINDTDIKGTDSVEEMRDLLNVTSTRTLANFVILRVIDFAVSQSISNLNDIYIRFQTLIDGREDRDQAWKGCVDVLSENLPFAVGFVYVQKYFKANMKASVVEMFNNIKDQFYEVIREAEWIDESTREKLLYKLKSIVPLIAFPDEGFNERAINEFYDGVISDKNQYLRTLFQLRVIDADNKFRQTYTSTALETSNDWRKYLPPTSVTALYSVSDNSIRFSAGILDNVDNSGSNINYLEFGSQGFIIAHEISHIVDQIFNDVDSLAEPVKTEFTAKKQCLIGQYSEYREPDAAQNLDGKRTFVENFADNTGIKLAYRAYRKWNEKFTGKREKLIGLGYTWDQLFWLSAAQTWCGVYRKEELTRKILCDNYATERFRSLGPLHNSPDFAADFNCSKSSSMNRKNKCIIW